MLGTDRPKHYFGAAMSLKVKHLNRVSRGLLNKERKKLEIFR